MATTASGLQPAGESRDKGLKAGALGLISSTVIATASVAPAYSLAATLGFVVVAVGLKSPLVAILAFVPMILTSIGYSELNKADPDCGITFTWATRAFGPRTGWAGGWAIVAADVLVMASLAQVAGQYIFLLFNADGIGQNPASGWVLLTGVLWIVFMTYICYRGIEVSANFQKALLSIEITMLLVLSVTALVRVGTGHHPPESIHPSWSWLSPGGLSFSAFAAGLILMVFIYWGWDTALSVNEETKDATRTPGRSAILSTIILVVTYGVAIFGAQSFAGIGTKGIGLANARNSGDVLSVLGHAVFGSGAAGDVFYRLLLLMVLSSAAASTQTTILPTARTTLSMATYRALPPSFAKMHPRYLTPTVSTVVMGGISIVLYAAFNYISGGLVIADAVTSCGVFIATYYGLTGFACAWYYRRNLLASARNLWMQGILPVLGGLLLWFLGGWSLYLDYDMNSANEASYTSVTVPGLRWVIGGVFVIVFLSWLAGLLAFIYIRIVHPAFFRKQTLTGRPRCSSRTCEDDHGPVRERLRGTGGSGLTQGQHLVDHFVDERVERRPREGGPGNAGQHDSVLRSPDERGQPERVVMRRDSAGFGAFPDGGHKIRKGLPAGSGSRVGRQYLRQVVLEHDLVEPRMLEREIAVSLASVA